MRAEFASYEPGAFPREKSIGRDLVLVGPRKCSAELQELGSAII